MIGENIKLYREQASLTQEALATKIGISKSAISMYENGNREPDLSTIQQIADALEVNMSTLIGQKSELSFDNLIPLVTAKISVIGEIACGTPIYAEETYGEYIACDKNIEADFALKCKGDSMINARINDGDIVFIKKQPSVDDGDIACVVIENEVTLKRVYYKNGTLSLVAENPKYPPMFFQGPELDQIYILGKAISFQSSLI